LVAVAFTFLYPDTSRGGSLLVKNSQLVLQAKLDRETTETIQATIVCSLSIAINQSAPIQVSRDISVLVQDVNDCGPVIVTSSGTVKVTRKTMTYGKVN
jgi:hypothetical protein